MCVLLVLIGFLTPDTKTRCGVAKRCSLNHPGLSIASYALSRSYFKVMLGLCPIESVDTPVTFVMQTLQTSTTTGSWIRSRRRRDRIQLPIVVEIISEVCKSSMTRVSTSSQSYFKVMLAMTPPPRRPPMVKSGHQHTACVNGGNFIGCWGLLRPSAVGRVTPPRQQWFKFCVHFEVAYGGPFSHRNPVHESKKW